MLLIKNKSEMKLDLCVKSFYPELVSILVMCPVSIGILSKELTIDVICLNHHGMWFNK